MWEFSLIVICAVSSVVENIGLDIDPPSGKVSLLLYLTTETHKITVLFSENHQFPFKTGKTVTWRCNEI